MVNSILILPVPKCLFQHYHIIYDLFLVSALWAKELTIVQMKR